MIAPKRKKESWEFGKSKMEIFKQKLKDRQREFNQKTHGMGFLVLLMLGGIIAFGILQIISSIIGSHGHIHIDQTITINSCFSGNRCFEPV